MKKNYTINFSIPRDTFWRVVLPLFLLAAVGGLLCGILVVDRLVMPHVADVNRGTVHVPPVSGKPFETARDGLLSVGLRWDGSAREYSDAVAAGVVISQFPEAGAAVKKGRQVNLIISRGPKNTEIPEVRNLNDRQARIELRKAGLSIGRIRQAYSDTVAKDLAISTTPERGATVSREMAVDLTMSLGPKPSSADVPNIVGEAIEVARQKIEDAGLTVGEMTYVVNRSVQPGTVTSQSPSPGTSVPLESHIQLIVSVQSR